MGAVFTGVGAPKPELGSDGDIFIAVEDECEKCQVDHLGGTVHSRANGVWSETGSVSSYHPDVLANQKLCVPYEQKWYFGDGDREWYSEPGVGGQENKKSIFTTIVGLTFSKVEKATDDEIRCLVKNRDDIVLRFYHDPDCCEMCYIEDITGDLNDLVDAPITMCEQVTSREDPTGQKRENDDYTSMTWTFLKLATRKGYVTVRWYGESNGYYSETPTAHLFNKKNNEMRLLSDDADN